MIVRSSFFVMHIIFSYQPGFQEAKEEIEGKEEIGGSEMKERRDSR